MCSFTITLVLSSIDDNRVTNLGRIRCAICANGLGAFHRICEECSPSALKTIGQLRFGLKCPCETLLTLLFISKGRLISESKSVPDLAESSAETFNKALSVLEDCSTFTSLIQSCLRIFRAMLESGVSPQLDELLRNNHVN